MYFDFDAEQYLIRDTAREILQRTCSLKSIRPLLADPTGFPRTAWSELADTGLLGIMAPERWGGGGLSLLDATLVCEEMGRFVFPAPFLETAILSVELLRLGGTEQQQAQWLPAIASGQCVSTVAWVEESGSWELDDVRLVARSAGSGYRLAGRKMFVPFADVADLVIVVARSADDGRLRLFLVSGDEASPGCTPLQAMDLTYRLFALDLDIEVGADAALGATGAEAEGALRQARASAAVALSAESIGGMDAVLRMSTEYAKERQQFGRPIGSFQAIKHKLANMLVDLESARVAVHYAAWAVAEGATDAPIAVARARACTAEAYSRCAAEGIQVHGGIAFTWEHDMHLYFKRAKRCEFTFGRAEQWWEDVLTNAIALDPALADFGERPASEADADTGAPPTLDPAGITVVS